MWADQSLGRVDMVYDFNGTEHSYAYYGSDNKLTNPRLDLGDLTTGTFTIKKLYWHCYDNWKTKSIDAFGWYTIGNGDTKIGEFLGYDGSNNDTDGNADHEIKNEGVSSLIATANTGNSGTFTFSHWFIANFHYDGGTHITYCSNGGDNYNFTFNILPPNASAITATPSGHISGSGTEDDPYIIPVGGDFSVSLSGSTKVRNDDNSAVQYSVDGGGTWGATSEYTSKTFSNVTATDLQNYVFKSRCYNSDADLESPTITEKTIYYKTSPWSIAGSMCSTDWDINENCIAHYTSGTGYVDIPLNANTTYEFKVKNRTNDEWYSDNSTLTYANHGTKTFSSSESANCKITTAGAGTYRFTWNGNDKQLTVSYPDSYTVTFGYGEHGTSVTASGSTSGSIESGKYVTSGEDVTFTETHESGYSLKGWYTTADGNTAVSGMSSGDKTLNSIAANANVYAQYTEDMHTITVAYECGGSSIHENGSVANVGIATSQSVTALDIEGYTFSTWSVMPSGVTTSSTLTNKTITITATANATITANYTLNSHTLTWNLDGGTITSESGTYTAAGSVSYGAALTAPTVEKDGYTFAGWSPSVASTMPDADVEYTATWTENTYTVTFANDGNGSTSPTGSQSVGVVTGVAINATPNTGYEFNTWTSSNGGTFTSEATTASNTFKPTSDATLTASFNAVTYNGVIDSNGGTSDGAYSVTFNDNKIDVTTPPTYAGYEVEEYHFTADLNMKIANKNESLVSDFSHDAVTYISGGKWVKDGAIRLYPKWGPITYTIALDDNFPEGTTTTPGSVNFTAKYGTSDYSAITYPTANGYSFKGFYTDPVGGTQIVNSTGTVNPNVPSYTGTYSVWDNTSTDLTFYAQWEPVALSFTNGGGDGSWTNTANWSPACVPTIKHDVTINAETTISGSAVAKSVTIGGSGKVTIEATGVLEVEGTVTNTDDSKLIINTSSSSQGALIYDITTAAPSATINMTMSYTGGNSFQYIASPVGGARVSSMLSGKGVYTYAWIEGKGWERRGYYDDFMGNEVIVINGQGSCIFSGLLCPSTSGSLAYTATPEDASAQGVNMIPNTLTAPIKIAAMSFSGSSDNGVHIWEDGSWHGYAPASTQAATAVIPALQGYAVLAESGGSVSFNYTDAVRGASSHNDALRAPKRAIEDTPDYMTISVITNERKVDLQLSEHAQFTTAIDKGWETIYMEGDGRFGQLYALADEKMSILATPDLEGTVLGFVPGEILNYTLSFEGDGKGYYLNDIEEQQSTLIEEGNTYTFSSGNNNAARFIVSRTPINKIATGVDAVSDGVKARKQMIDGVLYIIRDGRMYNAEGMLVK